MRELDNEFFEEYKRLDKLCREVFGSEKGVSEYIRKMELIAAQGKRNVPTWDRDYKRLKQWRWLRNQLAHDESAICEEEDLTQLQEFYNSIFATEDPLAILRKKRQTEPAKVKSVLDYSWEPKKQQKNPRTRLILRLIVAVLVVVVLFLVLKLLIRV